MFMQIQLVFHWLYTMQELYVAGLPHILWAVQIRRAREGIMPYVFVSLLSLFQYG